MSLKITVPKPCHENWAAMSPDEKGRFCSLCAKTVVDFTAMPQPEVEHYLLANTDKKVCGRFSASQLDDAPVTLHIPREALFRQTSFRNIFLLALLVSMGTTLFSCQNRTIGEVSVDGDTVTVDTITQNIKTQKETDPSICGVVPGDTITEVKFKPIICTGVTTGATVVNTAPPEPFITGDIAVMPDTVFVEKDVYNLTEVHIRPEFPGGINKFYEYISSNLKTTESIEGTNRKMYVSFIIEKDGDLSTIKVLRGVDKNLDTEVTGILKNSPKWTPAQIRQKNVRVQYSLPIIIKPKE
jgi:hypothetical protein